MAESESINPTAFSAAGEMARRLRETDWSATPLGPISSWPSSLKVAVGICLKSRFPMFVWWGNDLINIYNDAYIPVLGARHPDAFGKSARKTWADIWPVIGEDVEAVVRDGKAIYRERQRLVMERNGYPEETFFTYSHSPIPDDAGGIGGLFQVCVDETPRMDADRDHRDAADLRQIALNAAALGWWRLDLETRRVYCDDRFAEIYGLKGNSFPADEISALMDPVDRPRADVAVAASLDPTQRKPLQLEYRIRSHAGEVRWLESHGRAEFSDEGPTANAIGFAGTIADVTERRLAESNLRTTEDRLALAVAAGQLGTFYCPLPFGKILWNDKCKEHFFLPPDAEVDIDRFYAIIHPDDREPTRLAIEASVNDRIGYDIVYRTISPDGRMRFIRAIGRAYYDTYGRPTRFDGITLDVSEQKRADAVIRESEERYRLATRATANAIWDWDLVRNHVQWNEALQAMFGYVPDAVDPTGDWWIARIHPDDRERISHSIHAVIDNPALDRWEDDYRFAHAADNGSVPIDEQTAQYREVYDRGYVIRDEYGRGVRMIGAMQDLTERKMIERGRERVIEAERAARSEAERISRMKDEFLATLSHELRTPLNAMLGWAQVLKRGKGLSNDLVQGLEVIERNARAQSQIIEDLLDMSRIISGKVRLDVQRVDLADIVNVAVETARPSAETKGVRLQKVVDPLHGVVVRGDANRLQQILWNLISNAIKFTPRDGRVQVLLERVNSHLELSVIDTGEGIAPEFLPHVFDRFRQADASITRRHGGLGLGLSIVRQLAELHGGSVRAKSRGLGEGSTFIVALPLTVAHPEDEDGIDRRHPRRDAQSKVPDPGLDITGVRVLVVDDEPDARDLVKRLLEDRSAIVISVATADAAIELLQSQSFDVLVSDIGMPDVDGYTLMRRVRALPKERGGAIPSIALTAYARSEDRVKAVTAGFLMHVAKPVEPNELITMVAGAAGRIEPR